MAKHKKSKSRLEALLDELSWYDPDEWRITAEERELLTEFYASLNRLMQLRGRTTGGIKLGSVTFREKPKGVKLR